MFRSNRAYDSVLRKLKQFDEYRQTPLLAHRAPNKSGPLERKIMQGNKDYFPLFRCSTGANFNHTLAKGLREELLADTCLRGPNYEFQRDFLIPSSGRTIAEAALIDLRADASAILYL